MARTKHQAQSGGKGRKRPRELALKAAPAKLLKATAQKKQTLKGPEGVVRKRHWHPLQKRRFQVIHLLRDTKHLLRVQPFTRLLRSCTEGPVRLQASARRAIQTFTEDMTSRILTNAVRLVRRISKNRTLNHVHIVEAGRTSLGALPGQSELFLYTLHKHLMNADNLRRAEAKAAAA